MINKHNQKLIIILENQKIYGGFLFYGGFFKLAFVKSVKTVRVCIVIFFHYFKYYGQNMFSITMVLYLIANVERKE